MNTYMLLLRQEKIDFSSYTSEDFERIVAEFDKWNAAMIARSQLLLSANLKDGEGRVVRGGQSAQDGPFTEIREAVTGIFVVEAEDLEAAARLAAACPFVKRGGSVEVRMIPQLEIEDATLPILQDQMAKRQISANG